MLHQRAPLISGVRGNQTHFMNKQQVKKIEIEGRVLKMALLQNSFNIKHQLFQRVCNYP